MSETVDNTTTMGVVQYARHRGVDQALISRWKAKGRLVLDGEGRILVRASDAVLANDLHPTKGGNFRARAAQDAPQAAPAAEGASTLAPSRAGALGLAGASSTGFTLAEAAREEKFRRAQLLTLEIAERAGRLVEAEAVEREAFGRARLAQQALLSIPDRLAVRLAAETSAHRVHELMLAEIRRVVAKIAGAATDDAIADEADAA